MFPRYKVDYFKEMGNGAGSGTQRKGSICGGLNMHGPHRLRYLNACLVIREWYCLRRIRSLVRRNMSLRTSLKLGGLVLV